MVFIYYLSVTSGRMALVWRGDLVAKGRADTSPWWSHLCVCTVNPGRVTDRTWESQVYQVNSSPRKTHPDIQPGCSKSPPLRNSKRKKPAGVAIVLLLNASVSDVQSGCWQKRQSGWRRHIQMLTYNLVLNKYVWRIVGAEISKPTWKQCNAPQHKHSCFLSQYWQTTFSDLLFSWNQNVCLQRGRPGATHNLSECGPIIGCHNPHFETEMNISYIWWQ